MVYALLPNLPLVDLQVGDEPGTGGIPIRAEDVELAIRGRPAAGSGDACHFLEAHDELARAGLHVHGPDAGVGRSGLVGARVGDADIIASAPGNPLEVLGSGRLAIGRDVINGPRKRSGRPRLEVVELGDEVGVVARAVVPRDLVGVRTPLQAAALLPVPRGGRADLRPGVADSADRSSRCRPRRPS